MKILAEDTGQKNISGNNGGINLGTGIKSVNINISGSAVIVKIDRKQLLQAELETQTNQKGYIYFQAASGTNYPKRTIRLDNLKIFPKKSLWDF